MGDGATIGDEARSTSVDPRGIATRADMQQALLRLKAGEARPDGRRQSLGAIVAQAGRLDPRAVAPHPVQAPGKSTISEWLSGKRLPWPADADAWLTFLAVCGVPRAHFAAWLEALDRAWDDGSAVGVEKPDDPPLRPVSEPPHPASLLPEPAALPAPSAPADQGPRHSRVLLVAATGLVVVVVVAAGAWVVMHGHDSEPAAGPLLLSENFDDDVLDSARWLPPQEPDLEYAGDGVFNLVTLGTGPDEGVVSRLAPRDLGGFRQLDAVVAVTDVEVPDVGFASVTVTEEGGRTDKLAFGADGSGVVTAEALICRQAACTGYADYDSSGPNVPFELGEEFRIQVRQDDGELVLRAGDRELGRTALDTPLTGFTIDLSGAGREQWHMTLDSLRVYG